MLQIYKIIAPGGIGEAAALAGIVVFAIFERYVCFAQDQCSS